MKHTHTLFTALLLAPLADVSAAEFPDTKATASGKLAATDAKAVFQYKAGDIAILTATADESKAAAFAVVRDAHLAEDVFQGVLLSALRVRAVCGNIFSNLSNCGPLASIWVNSDANFSE